MKRITAKIILSGMFVMFLSSFIPNALWRLSGGDRNPEGVPEIAFLIGGLITVSVTLMVFSFLINHLLIKRVKNLNEATKSVMQGDFETTITDNKFDEVSELTNNFNQMVQELKANEYVNKEFVRNFSHELKTPISAIKGYAELVQSETLSEEEKQQYTKIIIDESERLSNLSKNMLLISQIDNQVIVPKNDTFNMTELFRNVVQLQQLDWEEKNIEFEFDVEDITITSNKELMYQVFQNLLSNAIRFSDLNDTIKVTINQIEQPVFIIENKGELTEEEQSKIFDLFYIKDKSRSSKSNGIGLTLTKKIIDKLEGTISVESKEKSIAFEVKL